MSSYEKYKDQIVATNKARRQALKILVSMHQEEFDRIYQVQAVEYGLNTTKVNARIARARKTEEDNG